MRLVSVLVPLFGVTCFVGQAFAEGGYYGGLLGSRAAGRGGAFTARADDITAVAYNPAGLAKIGGTLIQVGDAFSYNAASFTRATTRDWGAADGPTVAFAKVNNQKPWQYLDPLLGAASNLGLPGWGFALAAYAPPGIASEQFPVNGGERYMMVSRDVQMLNYAASVAWRYGEIFGLGVSLQSIYLRKMSYSLVIDGDVFKQPGNPVQSDYDILANVSASSPFNFNATLGTWYRPVPAIELGLSAQVVPANIQADGHLSVTALGSLKNLVLRKADGSGKADNVTLKLPLPMVFRAGGRYRHLDNNREVFDVEVDLEYTTWSRVNRFVLDAHDLVAHAESSDMPVGIINIEKQWRDTIAVKLGGDFAVIPGRLTLRAGGYYETAVAKPAYAQVDFPNGTQIGGTIGASAFVGPVELALVYQLRFQPSFSVSESDGRVYQIVPGSQCKAPYNNTDNCNEHYLNQPAPVVNAGTYAATSQIVAFDLLYRF